MGRDTFPLMHLPQDLPLKTDIVLFHERIHYWQLLSCSNMQIHFFNYLDKIRTEVMKRKGNYWKICGQLVSNDTSSFDLVAESLESYQSHMYSVNVLPNMIKAMNLISTSPLTDMPYMELPHKTDKKFLPAYGAVLGFESGNIVFFPFNGVYLMESATYISQLLYQGRSLPHVEDINTKEDLKILGMWEFWRRLHGSKYDSELCLAYSFLAAVDLALNGYVMEPGDLEYRSEMASIPYRFGKIAYRLQGFPPLELNKEEPAAAVNHFQEKICEYFGWPSLDISTKTMAISITQILVANYYYMDEDIRSNSIFDKLFSESTRNLSGKIEEFEQLWDLFRRVNLDVVRIGQNILQNMLNACIYRIKHPGEFILPHIYYKELYSHFPLPLILLNGRYCTDYDLPSNAVHDLISLMVLKSFADSQNEQFEDSETKCGFLSNYLDCFYIQSGLGCPY